MVILLAVGPGVAGFGGRQASMAYIFAAIIFVLAVLTQFPLGVVRVLRFSLHGTVELMIALMILILPWLAGFARGINSRNFYILMALLMLAVWFMTDFRGVRDRSPANQAQ